MLNVRAFICTTVSNLSDDAQFPFRFPFLEHLRKYLSFLSPRLPLISFRCFVRTLKKSASRFSTIKADATDNAAGIVISHERRMLCYGRCVIRYVSCRPLSHDHPFLYDRYQLDSFYFQPQNVICDEVGNTYRCLSWGPSNSCQLTQASDIC
jgi:hypothetical protein